MKLCEFIICGKKENMKTKVCKEYYKNELLYGKTLKYE